MKNINGFSYLPAKQFLATRIDFVTVSRVAARFLVSAGVSSNCTSGKGSGLTRKGGGAASAGGAPDPYSTNLQRLSNISSVCTCSQSESLSKVMGLSFLAKPSVLARLSALCPCDEPSLLVATTFWNGGAVLLSLISKGSTGLRLLVRSSEDQTSPALPDGSGFGALGSPR